MRARSTLAALATTLAIPSPANAQAQADFPCPGCILHVPTSAASGPRPLLVALHGDGGAMLPLVRAWRDACDAAGVILLAPRCPRELGCTTQSYWQWLAGRGHDDAWLGGLVDAVAARHDVDPARVFATGYSGGATYLGWYVPKHPRRFAAVAHVAGGAPLGGACPTCKVPVLFTIGATDPMIEPYTAPLRRYYEACGGHEITWQVLPGVTHESILGHLQAGRAKEILAWLLARPAACATADRGAPDAGSEAKIDASDAGPIDVGVVASGPIVEPTVRIHPPRSNACACSASDAPVDRAAIAACFAATLGLARRRTSKMRSRARLGSMPA